MDLTPYYQMVEECIKELGVDPNLCKGENEGQWDMKKGSANIWIDVFKKEKDFYGYFQCMAPISKIPADNTLEFYQEVLEKNHSLYGVGMTKFKDWIYIKIIRELEGLDQKEMMASLKRVGGYADDYDDYFKNKYFGGGDDGKPDAG